MESTITLRTEFITGVAIALICVGSVVIILIAAALRTALNQREKAKNESECFHNDAKEAYANGIRETRRSLVIQALTNHTVFICITKPDGNPTPWDTLIAGGLISTHSQINVKTLEKGRVRESIHQRKFSDLDKEQYKNSLFIIGTDTKDTKNHNDSLNMHYLEAQLCDANGSVISTFFYSAMAHDPPSPKNSHDVEYIINQLIAGASINPALIKEPPSTRVEVADG